MKAQGWLSRALVAISLGLVMFLRADATATQKTAHVVIPFDFWIQDTKLAAGTYKLAHVSSPTLVVFSSSDGKTSTEAFMLPVNDDPVKESEAKLVFLVQNGQHYLYEAWGMYGRRIVSSQYGMEAPSGDRRAEVPVVYQ